MDCISYTDLWLFRELSEKLFEELKLKIECDKLQFLFDIGDYENIAILSKHWDGKVKKNFMVDLKFIEMVVSHKKNIKNINFDGVKQEYIGSLCCYCVRNIELSDKNIEMLMRLLRNIKCNGSNISKSFFVKTVVDRLFLSCNSNVFRTVHYLILDIIYNSLLKTTGGKIYYDLVGEMSHKFLFKESFVSDFKVALCFSGALRPGWKENIIEIINILEKKCDISVFLYSWDQEYLWPGLGGNGIGWVRRWFTPIVHKCPKEILIPNTEFCHYFPSVYRRLEKEVSQVIDIKEIYKLSSRIKSVRLEKYTNISNKYGDLCNNSKMFYGYYQVYNVLEEYEKKEGIEYDFIIRLRPDYKLKSDSFLTSMQQLGFNEIAMLRGVAGLGDAFEVGRKYAMQVYMNSWRYIKNNIENEFFNASFKDYPVNCMGYNGILSHYILSDWVSFLKLRVVNLGNINSFINETTFDMIKFPDIRMELEKDLLFIKKSKRLSSAVIEEISDFFKLVYSKYEIIENHTSKETAKSRIQNQLSYKLGQAMIVNSKSFLGYIRMPFVLSYIKGKHKQEQKIYQEKIKKDPSLKLPPLENYPDYQEALRLKNHLSYKLGQALIQANKNWYSGGYVKLIFEIRKLKKKTNSKEL